MKFAEDSNGLVVLDEEWSVAESESGGSQTRLNRAEFLSSLVSIKFAERTIPPKDDLFIPPPPHARIPFFLRTESLLSQYKNPADQTHLTAIGYKFSQIRIFREFKTGTQSPVRYGIFTSVRNDALHDGSDNLALVLQELDFLGEHERVRDYLHRFCERFDDVKINVGEGLARMYLREAGLKEMLSTIRMSDGTLKFLSLLAALFHQLWRKGEIGGGLW